MFPSPSNSTLTQKLGYSAAFYFLLAFALASAYNRSALKSLRAGGPEPIPEGAPDPK